MNHARSRRTFIKQILKGGSTLMFGPSILGSAILNISDLNQLKPAGILPVAAVEDSFDLSFTLKGLGNLTKIALAGDINLKIPGNKGRLAPSLEIGNKSLVAVLEKIKQAYQADKVPNFDKLSLILGVLCNNTLSQQLMPIYQENEDNLEELVIYQDTYLLRAIAGKNADWVQREYLEKMLKELLPRTITRVHTLIPDSDKSMEWIVKMGKWRKENFQLMEKYARIYTQPNPKKEEEYIHELNFYNPSDLMIKNCRKIQKGENVSEREIKGGIEDALKEGSLYARVLASGVTRIELVDSYLQGKVDDKKLIQSLN